MENLAEAFLGLEREDFSLLEAIEFGMRDHEWVPLPEIARFSGLSGRKAEYRLGLLFRQKSLPNFTKSAWYSLNNSASVFKFLENSSWIKR